MRTRHRDPGSAPRRACRRPSDAPDTIARRRRPRSAIFAAVSTCAKYCRRHGSASQIGIRTSWRGSEPMAAPCQARIGNLFVAQARLLRRSRSCNDCTMPICAARGCAPPFWPPPSVGRRLWSAPPFSPTPNAGRRCAAPPRCGPGATAPYARRCRAVRASARPITARETRGRRFGLRWPCPAS